MVRLLRGYSTERSSGTLRALMSPGRSGIPVLAVVAALVGCTLFLLRPASRELRGDEGTYVAMAASLARDFDLEFDESDLAWAEDPAREGLALILQRTERGVAYSKPVLYPILAATLTGLLGEWGPAALNLILLLAAVHVAWRARLGQGSTADDKSTRDNVLTFVATGLALVYLPWRMTETLQLALALAGLALTFAALRRETRPAGELAGAALLGLLVSLREPNALVAAAPVAAALLLRQPRRALRLATVSLLSYGVVVLATWGFTGAANPYKAARSTFTSETGFPAGVAAGAAAARFDSAASLATSSLGVRPDLDPEKSAYAALYFLVGRHTGLLWYLPAALALGLAALASADRAGWAALACFAGAALFYLLWMPANYFGGETFVGNRYALAALPLLLVAPTRLPGARALVGTWILAAIVAGSALVSVIRVRALDDSSQSHAHAGLFRFLPYESTASHLDGRRDRYWAGDFVRFVDPFARAGDWSFELATGDPAAEVELATRSSTGKSGPLQFVVQGSAPDLGLEISDAFHRERFRLTAHENGGAGGPVQFEPSRGWRRHRFWWSREATYDVRMLRFRATRPSGDPATIRVRYLGREPAPSSGLAREVVAVGQPSPAFAGEPAEISFEVRNTGEFVWQNGSTLPTQIGLRFLALESPDARASEARRPLPGPVAPGESLVATIPIVWPERPGRYRVTLDLVLEDVAWFEERVGAPLARAEIEVRAKGSASPPAPR